MQLTIRPATDADIVALIQLDDGAWHSGNTPSDTVGQSAPDPADTWIAFDGSMPAGYVRTGPYTSLPSAAHVRVIRSIAVDAAYRRHGVGRALLAHLEAHLAQLGVRKLMLNVLSTNLGAIRLYETCGYRREAELTGAFYRDGAYVDDYVYAKALVPQSPVATPRRPLIGVIGNSEATPTVAAAAEAVGRAIIDAGYRLVTGGRGGVMEAASRGAHLSARYRPGDVIAMLPGHDHSEATAWADIVLPTRLGLARNTVIAASADVVVAVGGGAGTLSEIAYAWQFDKPVVAFDNGEGWASRLAGETLDARRTDTVVRATNADEVIAAVRRALDAQ